MTDTVTRLTCADCILGTLAQEGGKMPLRDIVDELSNKFNTQHVYQTVYQLERAGALRNERWDDTRNWLILEDEEAIQEREFLIDAIYEKQPIPKPFSRKELECSHTELLKKLAALIDA